jgi:hypothetical protein
MLLIAKCVRSPPEVESIAEMTLDVCF